MARQQTGYDTAQQGAGNLNRASKAMSSGGDAVSNLQKFAAAEQERQRKKKEEEEAAKKNPVNTAPQKGFVQSMIDKYWYGKKDQ